MTVKIKRMTKAEEPRYLIMAIGFFEVLTTPTEEGFDAIDDLAQAPVNREAISALEIYGKHYCRNVLEPDPTGELRKAFERQWLDEIHLVSPSETCDVEKMWNWMMFNRLWHEPLRFMGYGEDDEHCIICPGGVDNVGQFMTNAKVSHYVCGTHEDTSAIPKSICVLRYVPKVVASQYREPAGFNRRRGVEFSDWTQFLKYFNLPPE